MIVAYLHTLLRKKLVLEISEIPKETNQSKAQNYKIIKQR